jgi:hypothetical protein
MTSNERSDMSEASEVQTSCSIYVRKIGIGIEKLVEIIRICLSWLFPEGLYSTAAMNCFFVLCSNLVYVKVSVCSFEV